MNNTPLSAIGLPATAIDAAGGEGDALPRGFMVVRTLSDNAQTAILMDPVLQRSLSHKVVFERIDKDPWGDARPRPRYSVGPTGKDVTHYI